MTHKTRALAGVAEAHHHDDHGSDHHHGHDHASVTLGLPARVAHLVSEALGAHSHDPVDQVDDALEADATGRRALLISLLVLALTAGAQAAVVMLSGSVALLGDALHNIADALTAVPLLIAFRLARRAPTKTHTYGYGRAEDLAGLFVIAMITLSAALATFESVRRLMHPQDVTHLWAVAAAAVIGFLGNEVVARYRIRVGRQIGSAALVADGLHARTDGYTSLAVLLGVGGVAVGWRWADPVVGLVITIAILGVLRSAIHQVGGRLMDAVEPGLHDRATRSIQSVEGIHDVLDLRLRWIGHTLRAEADVSVDPTISIATAHDLAHHAEDHLLVDVPRLTAATIHVSPAGAHSATPG
jgi:cation diffusion facilitator family transporter